MDTVKPNWMTQGQFDNMTPEQALMLNELTSLSKGNMVAFQEILMGGIMPDPMALTSMLNDLRFDTILSQLFPDPEERIKFELHWEEKVKGFLVDLANQARKARLAMPRTPGIIDPRGQG